MFLSVYTARSYPHGSIYITLIDIILKCIIDVLFGFYIIIIGLLHNKSNLCDIYYDSI